MKFGTYVGLVKIITVYNLGVAALIALYNKDIITATFFFVIMSLFNFGILEWFVCKVFRKSWEEIKNCEV